jgi:hypothetical protein
MRSGGQAVLLARRTEEGMKPDDLLCSCNTRPQKGKRGSSQTILLARRTRTMKQCSSDARSEGQPDHSFMERWRENWKGRVSARS